MHNEFEMSMMGELNLFLGLQINQLKKGTFINQEKYIIDLLKRFNMEEAKTMKTPMSSSIKLDKDEKGKSIDSTMYRGMIGLWYLKSDSFELIHFSDVDFAGCKVERKNSSDTCHFLGHSLVSWHRVEICLDSESIFHIFDIALVGLKVYKSKMWPIVSGFEPRKAIKRICGLLDAHEIDKPLAHNLTVISRVLHHMLFHYDWETNPIRIFDDDAHDCMLREPEDRDIHILELRRRHRFERWRTPSQTGGVQFEKIFSEPSYIEPSFFGPAFIEPTHTEIPHP
ncbi:hypothetical protein AAG906_008964 [Vitis piasezkii]